jgi:hypothetical protein
MVPFTPSLLLAIGLLIINALIVARMKDPQREYKP